MKSSHIIEILDGTSFIELSEQDKATIWAHADDCHGCRQAFEAARISSILLKAHESRVPEPSPFFQAKVMNAWRERQMPRRPMEAFRRWWQASAAPVFLMVVTLAVLISLTFLAPQSSADDSPVEISGSNLYSTDAVIYDQKASRDLTTEQVFQVIYDAKSDSRR